MEQAADKRRNPALAWLKEIAIIVAVALLLSFLIKTFLFRAFYIPSTSMENTLEVNDRIFVNLLVPQPIGLERGDVVVFRDDLGWLPANGAANDDESWFQQALTFVGLLPDSSEQHLVKRVIGIGGDRVVCCDADGKITVNGQALDESYLHPDSTNVSQPFDVVVPDDKIWVMGDNRNHSADSREHRDEPSGGFIDLEAVEGKAGVIAWPLDRLAMIGNYPEVFDAVPPGDGGSAPANTPAGRSEQEGGQ